MKVSSVFSFQERPAFGFRRLCGSPQCVAIIYQFPISLSMPNLSSAQSWRLRVFELSDLLKLIQYQAALRNVRHSEGTIRRHWRLMILIVSYHQAAHSAWHTAKLSELSPILRPCVTLPLCKTPAAVMSYDTSRIMAFPSKWEVLYGQ